MSIKLYFIDDMPDGMELLNAFLLKIPDVESLGMETDSYIAMQKLLSKEIVPDVVYMDIDMPRISGTELAPLIKDLALIVFTTAHRHYAPEAFEHNVVDYLLKPISFDKFNASLDKVRKRLSIEGTYKVNDDSLTIPGNGKSAYNVIDTRDILYIEGHNTYVKLFMNNLEEHLTNLSLQEIEKLLSSKPFIRVHKSYIVNIKRISGFDTYDVFLTNKKIIPIGETFKKNVMKLLRP